MARLDLGEGPYGPKEPPIRSNGPMPRKRRARPVVRLDAMERVLDARLSDPVPDCTD